MTLSVAERRAFFQEHSPAARKVMFSSGFLASITLAQMGLEGGYGRSSLARVYFNHFGIKGKGDAGSVLLPTKEEVGGVMITVNANFRAYTSLEAGLADRTQMLYNARRSANDYRYRHLFGVKDYITVARGLKRGGYATDSLYAEKLISIIQEFDLEQYDKGEVENVPNETPKPPVIEPRSTPAAWAKESVEWAKNNQIFDGLRLNEFLTREEFAVILNRFNAYELRIITAFANTHKEMFTDIMNTFAETQNRMNELEVVVENLDKTTQALTPRKSLLSFLNPTNWGVKK